MKALATTTSFVSFVIAIALLCASGNGADAAPNGASLYVDKCGMCHAANGEGLPPAFPPLARNPHVTTKDPNTLIAEILYGMPLTDITVQGHHYGGGMPAWGNWLSNAEVAAIATYVRAS